ncbi:MAG: CRISPR-associated helicase Cas3' [Clostridia bacterium]|nr:CRISPR-associated helicase Cas3' [Clostridia bacterium]
MYIAHTKDGSHQGLKEHLTGVAELAEKYCERFDNGEYGRLCGLMHDMGKYSAEFQKKIKNNLNLKVDHSTAGAIELNRKFPRIGKFLSYCIAGHHGGLPDGGSKTDTEVESTLMGRLKRSVPVYSSYAEHINLSEFIPKKKPSIILLNEGGFSVSFYIRMLYSALVDADFLDTERFMTNGETDREIEADFSLFQDELEKTFMEFGKTEGKINERRNQILKNCLEKANKDRGLYSLTVPTGGGKTISSFAFAVNHAKKNNMDRIIYVIPYTSILEQNAEVFKKIVGEKYVLEHHSNFDFGGDDENVILKKHKLSSENWDIPIVVTTNVQFFESLFSNKPSKCRKLHNIANSVIIFDEVQMLPVQYLTPCVMAIAELVANYKSTCVLCSATQPAIDDKFPNGIRAEEICDNTQEMYNFFRRVEVVKKGRLPVAELAEQMKSEKQCLCIVNSKKHALAIYKEIESDDSFHLSTRMCPKHRKNVIEEIKARLKTGFPCRVVSTQLIEAGVDVDFPVVYRAAAGIDSIVQACGRCNREGKLKKGFVYVFDPEDVFLKSLPHSMGRTFEIAREIMSEYEDIMSMQAIKEYFNRLYPVENLDIKNIFKRFEDGIKISSYPFKTIASEFKMIDEDTQSIIIPYDEKTKESIKRLKYSSNYRGVLRSLQNAVVNVYENEFKSMLDENMLDVVDEGIYVLKDMNLYSNKTGLKVTNKTGVGIFL